jgi:hypothetical protein
MVVEPVVPIARVAIRNVVMLVPAGTVMLAGTVAREVAELVRVRTAPPAGAGPFSVTIPVAPNPAATLDWFRASDERSGIAVTVVVFVTLA